MSTNYLNFTTYKCFLCNNGQDFSKSRNLIKHVIEEHCYTSETSEELCLPCSVKNCWWEKSCQRKHAIPAKVCLHDIHYAYSVLFEHLVKYHNLPVPDYIKTIRCSYPQCRFECFKMESLNRHVSTHAAKVSCESCGQYFRPDTISRHLEKCTLSKHAEARGELHSSISRATRDNSVKAHHVDERHGLHTETTRNNNSIGACQEKLPMADLSLKSRRSSKYVETTLQQLTTKFFSNSLNFLSYKCFLCNNEPDLKSYRQLCDHLLKEHCQLENNDDLIFPCPKVACPWQKITKKNNRKNGAFIKRCFCLVLKHLNIKHKMAVPTYVRQFQCKIPYCKFRSVELDGLTQHMISHDKKITCCKCGKFLKAYYMKKHLERCPNMRKQDGENSEEQLKKIVENRSGDNESKISRDDFEEPSISRRNQIEKRLDMQNDISTDEKPSVEFLPSYTMETSPSVALEAISNTDPTLGLMTVADYDEDTEIEMEQESDAERIIEKKEEIMMSNPSGKNESPFEFIPNKSVDTYQAAGDSHDPGYSESALILQEERNHGTLRFKFYQCFVCFDKFTEFTDYFSLCRHIEQEHCLELDDRRIEWKCQFCNYRQTFSRKLGRMKMMRLLTHMNANHNFGFPSCIDPYACTVPGCSFKCLRRDELISSHKLVHEDRVPCEKCGKIFRAGYLKNHGMRCKLAERTQASAKCSHCDKEFSSKWSLKSHMNSFHAEVKDHMKICTICSKQYTSNSSLLEHSVKAHNVNIADRPILTCPKCPFQSTIEGRLKTHFQNRHTETKSFVCTSCQKCFNSKCKLNAHVRQSHGERTYNCTKCDYTSTRLNNLNQHFKAQHTMNKFTCEICGYTTGYFANLCKHKRQSSCRLKLKDSTLTS